MSMAFESERVNDFSPHAIFAVEWRRICDCGNMTFRSGWFGLSCFGLGNFSLGTFRSDYEILKKKADATKLEAFEMWVWRRLVKVKWTDKKTNAEVLNLVKEKKSWLSEVRKRKMRWISHILRHENMLRTVLEGRMKGKRPRGRKIIKMVDDIMTGTCAQMKRRAEDRDEWRRDVMRDLP